MAVDTELRNHPDVLWYPRWDNWTNVKADWSTYPNTYGDAPNTWPKLFYTTAPEFGGIPAGRFESVSTSTTSQVGGLSMMDIAWLRKYFNSATKGTLYGTPVGDVPLKDVYVRYCIMVESDVWAGINETGMKLPGLYTDERIGGGMGTIMHHTVPGEIKTYSPPYSLSEPIRLATYWGGGDLRGGATWGKDWLTPPQHDNMYIQPNRWYCIEQHLVMNTVTDGVANPDGLMDLWVDDELVVSLRNLKISTSPEIQSFFALIYHGGMNHTPVTPIHYRLTGVALAKRRIGMPKRVY